MKVKFSDLQAQYNDVKNEIDNAIGNVLEKGDYILGHAVSNFEKEFAAYIGTRYAIGVDNGTTALELALRTLGIGKGDEVITVANSFIATTLAISAVGADVVLVDCEYESMLMDVSQIEEKITPKTKAIIPVHLFGRCVDMKAISAIAQQHNLFIIEDASQAHGAIIGNVLAGSLGHINCFSLYPAKNLGSCGDAGIITTDNEKYYNNLIKLRNYGSSKKYFHDFKGKNARLDTIQAAILNVKLKKLNEWNGRRRWAAETYNIYFEENGMVSQPFYDTELLDNVWHLYVIKVNRRNELQQFLRGAGIETGIHYPIPIHKQVAYPELNSLSFPNAEKLSEEILSLPMHPFLTESEIIYVCEKVKEFYQ